MFAVLSSHTMMASQFFPWWRHQMETFSALLSFCAGNSPVTGEFPAQRPVTRSFDTFFDLCLNKRLSKQSWGWWSETPSSSLWRHYNATGLFRESKVNTIATDVSGSTCHCHYLQWRMVSTTRSIHCWERIKHANVSLLNKFSITKVNLQ